MSQSPPSVSPKPSRFGGFFLTRNLASSTSTDSQGSNMEGDGTSSSSVGGGGSNAGAVPKNSGAAPKNGGGALPPASGPRRPLPKYTSIDLEHELPDMFATSLNPNLRDPDMSSYYSGVTKPVPPRTRPTLFAPPPLYPMPEESPGQETREELPAKYATPSSPQRPLYQQPLNLVTGKQLLALCALCFFVMPLSLLLVFTLADALHYYRGGNAYRGSEWR